MTARRSPVQLKIIALILLLGSIFGIVSGALVAVTIDWWIVGLTVVIADVCYLALFCVCFWVGLRLWSDAPGARKWAARIFLAQIPSFTLWGFMYDFETFGLSFRVSDYDFQMSGLQLRVFSPASLSVGFQFGSKIAIFASPQIGGAMLGINIVAIAAALYLLRLRANATQHKNDLGLV